MNIHEGQTSTALSDLEVGQKFVLYGGSGYHYLVLKPAKVNVKGEMTVRVQGTFQIKPQTLKFPNVYRYGYDEVMVLEG